MYFFRDYGLRQGKWDWRCGASLTTYFVGACVCCFPKVFQRWRKEQQVAERRLAMRERDDATNNPLDRLVDPRPDPLTMAVMRDEAGRAMRQVTDPQLREVLVLHTFGYTQAEAARDVGLTPKAAERRLDRHRKKLSNDAPADPVDPADGRT